MDHDPGLVTARSGFVEIDDVWAWVQSGSTLFMAACAGGHLNLAKALADRGSDVHALSRFNWNALIYACKYGHIEVAAMLLDKGIDVHHKETRYGKNALHRAAYYDHLDICLLLLSKGADLMAVAVDNSNRTALNMYGNGISHHPPTHARPALTKKVKEQSCELLRDEFAEGPHPSQVQRRKDVRWEIRWAMMQVVVGCGFHPLAARRAELEQTALPHNAVLPRVQLETSTQRLKHLKESVFGNEGVMKHIVKLMQIKEPKAAISAILAKEVKSSEEEKE